MVKTKIPRSLQGVLWSAPIEAWDIEKHKTEIIHRVLRYGSLKDIKWLKAQLPKEVIKSSFVKNPRKIYSNQTYNFIKNIVLGIRTKLDEKRYIELPF